MRCRRSIRRSRSASPIGSSRPVGIRHGSSRSATAEIAPAAGDAASYFRPRLLRGPACAARRRPGPRPLHPRRPIRSLVQQPGASVFLSCGRHGWVLPLRFGSYGGGASFTSRLVRRLSLDAGTNDLPDRGPAALNWGYRVFAIGPRLRLHLAGHSALYLGFRPAWGWQSGSSQQTVVSLSGPATSTIPYTNHFWGFDTAARCKTESPGTGSFASAPATCGSSDRGATTALVTPEPAASLPKICSSPSALHTVFSAHGRRPAA